LITDKSKIAYSLIMQMKVVEIGD